MSGGRLILCGPEPNTQSAGRFSVRRNGESRRLSVRHPLWRSSDGLIHGSWDWAAASPDGRTILAQWSGECEIPMAFFVAASGGKPASVTGHHTRRAPPPNSIAYGWSTDGRAIVIVPRRPGCGGADGSGVFLIEVNGRKKRIAPAPEPGAPEPQLSLRPRSVREVKRALSG